MIIIHQIAADLCPGEAIVLDRDTMVLAARQNLESNFDSVRESDIENVARFVNETWDGFSLRPDILKQTYTLRRDHDETNCPNFAPRSA